MTDKPFARKRSGGPRTAQGKAVVAGNALRHGVNARLVILDDEDPAEFENLFQGLVADFKPQGTAETIIVHRMAHVIWKQRRLDTYEHQQVSQAALVHITPQEILRKMNTPLAPRKVAELFDLLEEPEALDDQSLAQAQELILECEEFRRLPHLLFDPQRGPQSLPRLWKSIVPMEWQSDAKLARRIGLIDGRPHPEVLKIFTEEVQKVEEHARAIVFLAENRQGIEQARAAVRAEKMTAAWSLDRSHRYHTLLEGQFYRALKELRQLQQWRLAQIPDAS